MYQLYGARDQPSRPTASQRCQRRQHGDGMGMVLVNAGWPRSPEIFLGVASCEPGPCLIQQWPSRSHGRRDDTTRCQNVLGAVFWMETPLGSHSRPHRHHDEHHDDDDDDVMTTVTMTMRMTTWSWWWWWRQWSRRRWRLHDDDYDNDDDYDDDIDCVDLLRLVSYPCHFVCYVWYMIFWHYRVIIYMILWYVLVYVLICTRPCTILICKDPCLIFRNSESSSNSGIGKVMGNNTNSCVVNGSVRIRAICLLNLISVINLTLFLIYLGLVDRSRALVYCDETDHRILGSLGTIDGTPEHCTR